MARASFQTGVMRPSPLLAAYDSTWKALDAKNRTNILADAQDLDEAKFEEEKYQYQDTGRAYTKSATAMNNQNVLNKAYELDKAKEGDSILDVIYDAQTNLNSKFDPFKSGISAKDLIQQDESGALSFNKDLDVNTFGSSMSMNEIRAKVTDELVGEAASTYPNLDESDIRRAINQNWETIYGEQMNSFYNDFNRYIGQAFQDELGTGNVTGEQVSEFLGQNPQLHNILAPGLIASGQDPNTLQYGVGGYNINLGIDKASWEKNKQASQDFTYKLEYEKDKDDNIIGQKWVKVAVDNKGFEEDSSKKKAETSVKGSTNKDTTSLDYDNFDTESGHADSAFMTFNNFNDSNMTGSQSFEDQPQAVRKKYYRQINDEFSNWYNSKGWGAVNNISITAGSDGNDYINIDYNAGNFLDGMWRDDQLLIKYTSDGRPYATMEGEWGDNNEHTIWLDDSWNEQGYDSISEFIAMNIYYKSDSSNSTWEHMGD